MKRPHEYVGDELLRLYLASAELCASEGCTPCERLAGEYRDEMEARMMLDDHNACPACALQVRNVYAAARRVLERERPTVTPDHEELHLALEALRPFVEAHHSNQLHAFSIELEDARHPKQPEAV